MWVSCAQSGPRQYQKRCDAKEKHQEKETSITSPPTREVREETRRASSSRRKLLTLPRLLARFGMIWFLRAYPLLGHPFFPFSYSHAKNAPFSLFPVPTRKRYAVRFLGKIHTSVRSRRD